jgi:hypothetical protein
VSFVRLTPQFEHHPAFDSPADSAALWRYMDFPRFIALLERRALFFSSIRCLADRFEGALTPGLLAAVEGLGEAQVRSRRLWNYASYINCWNESEHESVALWSMYASPAGGVAIRSSMASILDALAPDTSGLTPPDALYVGSVRYLDYGSADIPDGNAFSPIVHKRLAYEFEHEVRLVAWPQRLISAAQAVRMPDWWEALEPIAPSGYDIAVNPDRLIEAVVLAPEAPEWLVALVTVVSARYGLTALVRRSDLDAEPA